MLTPHATPCSAAKNGGSALANACSEDMIETLPRSLITGSPVWIDLIYLGEVLPTALGHRHLNKPASNGGPDSYLFPAMTMSATHSLRNPTRFDTRICWLMTS